MHKLVFAVVGAVALLLSANCYGQDSEQPEELASWQARYEERDVRLTALLESSPEDVDVLSARGDVRFFLGRYDDAVADYAAMSEVKPALSASHWRLGIARYFAGDFKGAAKQFEQYHTQDDVDRENGIWRFLSQVRGYDRKYAERDLLKYRKDDRPPFATVYRMFSGELTPAEVVQNVEEAIEAAPESRGQQEFYLNLYVGLYLEMLGEKATAKEHLDQAAASPWPRKAGYGPEYMRQVARLAASRLSTEAARRDTP